MCGRTRWRDAPVCSLGFTVTADSRRFPCKTHSAVTTLLPMHAYMPGSPSIIRPASTEGSQCGTSFRPSWRCSAPRLSISSAMKMGVTASDPDAMRKLQRHVDARRITAVDHSSSHAWRNDEPSAVLNASQRIMLSTTHQVRSLRRPPRGSHAAQHSSSSNTRSHLQTHCLRRNTYAFNDTPMNNCAAARATNAYCPATPPIN